MLIMIAAMNSKRTLGKDGQIPWRNPEDLRHFRNATLNQHVVMGRKTIEALPGPLDKRIIHEVSRSAQGPNGIRDFQTFLDTEHPFDVYIAGGGEIYAQSMPYVQRILLSIIDDDTQGDTFFPEIPEEDFEIHAIEHRDTFTLIHYERKINQ